MLKGKRLSILGDSISTYQGISNDASKNITIGDNPYYYPNMFPVEETYWQRVMTDLNLELCVNNSWSGGNLTGRGDPNSGVERAKHLSDNAGQKPDMIIVFMGMNDLGRRIPVTVFEEDYTMTLQTIKKQYPEAVVCCVNLPDREVLMKKQTLLFNQSIDRAVQVAGDGFFVADLFHSRLNNDDYYNNTVDGLHPDSDGMKMIAEVIKEAIERLG